MLDYYNIKLFRRQNGLLFSPDGSSYLVARTAGKRMAKIAQTFRFKKVLRR
jgi:sugar lactone lactonase YvrE